MTIGHLRCPHYASCLQVRRRVILINEGLPVLNLQAKRWSDLYFPKQDTGRSDFRTLPFVLELDIEQAGSPVSLARESFPRRSVDRWSPGRDHPSTDRPAAYGQGINSKRGHLG